MPADLEPALAESLAALAGELHLCREPWWLIGSAAMAVHGAPVAVRDIDLLLAAEDARAILAARGLPAAPGVPSSLFSSAVFASWDAPPYGVELSADFRVNTPEGWRDLRPTSREAHQVGCALVYVPAVTELIDWGRLFGRTKDREREPLLRALLA